MDKDKAKIFANIIMAAPAGAFIGYIINGVAGGDEYWGAFGGACLAAIFFGGCEDAEDFKKALLTYIIIMLIAG